MTRTVGTELALLYLVGTGLHGSVRIGAVAATMGLAVVVNACRHSPPVAPQANQPDLHAALMSIFSAKSVPRFVVRNRTGRRLWIDTREFYQKHGFAPVWLDRGRPHRRAAELIDALQRAGEDALDPARYGATDVAKLRDDVARAGQAPDDGRAAAALDARLTYLYLQFSSDLVNGVTLAQPHLKRAGDAFDAGASLDDALAHDSVGAEIAKLQQRDPEYRVLRNALATYRKIAANGGWPEIPATARLKPGERSPVVSVLAKRLAITGDYTPPSGTPVKDAPYDDALQQAVKRFEERHGLESDGVVGRSVVAELNVPADVRARQIALNMERWRWLPRHLGDRHIVVNIPEYRLEVYDHGSIPLSMRVVVGKKDSPTPSFTSDMSYLVLAPFWNVPEDIAEQETVPSAIRDPAFLRRTNMEVVDKRGRPVKPDDVDLSDTSSYRFRQRPGSTNSLGLVKFMFPNSYNVYLHDTPADALFQRETRAFSHGCVRLEEPEQLAQYVLKDQPEWTADRLRDAMHASTQTRVTLREKIPVYLVYLTARASADGRVFFFRDVYGRDGR